MGANNADFHGLTITHQELPYDEMLVTASHPDHGEIAHMQLSKEHGGLGGRVVIEVQTAVPFQRKGIATSMWKYAETNGLKPLHSSSRTEAGDNFAKSVGGYLPINTWDGIG